jgi:phosphohistidine phosphatase
LTSAISKLPDSILNKRNGMKTLFLLRHAKSSWADASQTDFDRPLNERGLKAAPLIGRFMRKQKLQPDLILSSPAQRARQTITLVAEAAELTAELRYDARLYGASAARLIEIVSQIEDSAADVLLVGHNNGMEELLQTLTRESRHMPTAALARITLNIEKWSKTSDASGQLDWLIKPKELASA